MQVLTGKEEQRDICSIGLKTVVLEMPGAMAVTAVRQLAPKLVSGMPAGVHVARGVVVGSAIGPPRCPLSSGHSLGTARAACPDRNLPPPALPPKRPLRNGTSATHRRGQGHTWVKLESMDILNDLLKRFGGQLREEESDACLTAL